MKTVLIPPCGWRLALGIAAAARRTVFVATLLTMLIVASHRSVLAQAWTMQTTPFNCGFSNCGADNFWLSVTYGNGLFVAVAYNGTGNRVMTSPDGITWTARTSAANNDWQSVTYGNGLFVAVAATGTGNRVMSSPDGITWTTQTSAADNVWRSVTFGNGLFVAVAETGTGNRVMTSPDGATWTAQTSAVDNIWRSVTYGNGLFVAVAISGTGNRVMTSPDGTNWTARTSAADNSWEGVTYGNGLFVAVATSGTGNRVMTSPDGTNWTARNSAANNTWKSVTYGNGLFVAVAETGTGNRVMTSPDGANWTARTSAADNGWLGVTYGNGLFVAVANSGTGNRVMTSTNGATWTTRASTADNEWYSVTYGNGMFVAVASSGAGNRVMTSPDGITWTARTSPADNNWVSVTYGNGLFVAVANSGTGNRVMTSPDGITWTLQTSVPDNFWLSVTYGNGLFVAVATTGTGNRVMTSPDGITWTSRTSAANLSWFSVTYGNGLFVAVSRDGTGNRVMTSPDGITWTSRTSPNNEWRSVTYGNGLFVAVASSGTGNRVMTSPDGITWTSRTSTADYEWYGVIYGYNSTYGNGLFVAVALTGVDNRVMTSPDGITWTARATPVNLLWRSVAYGNGVFVAVSIASSLSTGKRVMTWQPQMSINTGNSQTGTVGTAVATAPSVIVRDALNNPVSNVSVTFEVATGGGSVSGGATTTNASGIATVGSWTLGAVPGSNTLTATSPGLTGSPLTFTATGTVGAATQIAINGGNNQTATVGTAVATAPSVLVRDALNNPVSGVSVTFAVATGGGSVSGATTTTNASGIATVGGWTLGTIAGSNTLTATSSGLTGSPLTFTATGTAGAATQIAINGGNNQTATVGTTVATAPSVLVQDALNNPVAGVSVTFAVATGGGSVSGGTTTTNASGIATVGGWTLGTIAGSNSLTATSSGLTGSPLIFTATGTVGAATQIAINTGNNQTATVGTAVATAPSVIVQDALNNPVSGISVTFAVATGGGSISVGTTTTNASGIATVGGWTLGTIAGSNTLTATSPGLTGSPLTFTATGTAGAATQIAINTGNNQTATVGTTVATAPSVLVQDALNNPVAGVSVTFAVATGGGSVSGGTTTTNASGIATVGGWTLGTIAGSNSLTATSSGLTGSPLTFTATGTAGAATQIAINGGNNQTATVGSAIVTVPSVIVRDALNNPVSGVSVTFAVATGGGSVSGGTTATNASGIATVGGWTLGTTAGSNTLTASSSGLTGSPLIFTATGTVGAATQIAINTGNNQTATVGTAVATAPSVLVQDALNNPVAGVSVTFAVATGGGSVSGGTTTTNASGIATVGSWTLGMTPINTLTATSTGLSGSPVTFTAAGNLPLTGSMQVEGTAVPGGTVTVMKTLTNTQSTSQSITLNVPLPAGLSGVSCVSATGTCVIGATTVSATGRAGIYRKQSVSSTASTTTLTWTGTIPGNGTMTITYVVQVSAVASNGTQYQLTSTINGFSGPGATMTVSATPVGPGDSIGLVLGYAAAQKSGSVLIYNLYSSGFNPAVSDSRISITNTSPVRSSYVHFFFVDGSNCSVADMTITLTPNQTTSFLASDFDPGVVGYLIAVATDADGCPEAHNYLVGESQVRLESGHRAALPALSVAALGLGGPSCSPNATTTTLSFDGLNYNPLSRTLAVSGLSSIANGYSTLLVVNRIGGDLGTGAARLGSLFGLLYDDQEASQSFTLTGNVCQLRGVLGNNFPRTSPRYTTVIPAGRTGWMKFAAVADEAITGVLLVEALDGFNGGHNLHYLTTTNTATLTIPVYPAR